MQLKCFGFARWLDHLGRYLEIIEDLLCIHFYFSLIILSNDSGLVWLIRQLSSEWEATRIEALHWIATLLNKYRTEVTRFFLNPAFILSIFEVPVHLRVHLLSSYPHQSSLSLRFSCKTLRPFWIIMGSVETSCCCLCPMS